jgi:hypothetical protein
VLGSSGTSQTSDFTFILPAAAELVEMRLTTVVKTLADSDRKQHASTFS